MYYPLYCILKDWSYVDGARVDPKLPRRFKMGKVVIPRLDRELDSKVAKRIDGLIRETGCMLISDGWTSVQSRPIMNINQCSPVHTMASRRSALALSRLFTERC